jgi:tetratricopeptide (TPR) repeat protein
MGKRGLVGLNARGHRPRLGLKNDPNAGIAECEIGVRLNPNFATAHHKLGFVLVGAGRYEEAISCFDQAIKPRGPDGRHGGAN